MIGGNLEYLMLELEGWARGLPRDAVRYRLVRNPPDDEYGAVAMFTFEPDAADACALEVILVDEERGPAVGLVLDSFGRIARRIGVRPGRSRAALFREPRVLPVEEVLELCKAVAAGRVELTVGLWNGRPGVTRGAIRLGERCCRPSGIGGPLWLYRMLEPAGITRLVALDYRPWVA